MKKGRKTVSIILIIAVCVCAAAGIVYAVKRTTSGGTVMVVPASDINYNWYYGGSAESVEGTVTTDAAQNVYVTQAETVAAVYVKEGDKVKEGDMLVLFDTEQAAIALAHRELELDQIRLSKDVAERNIETLKRIIPVYEGDDSGEELDEFDEMDEFEDEEEYGEYDMEPYEVLKKDSLAYNDSDDDESLGMLADPYRFLVYDDRAVTVKRAFVTNLIEKARKAGKKNCYVTLEAHEENNPYAPVSGDMRNYFMTDLFLWEKSSGDLALDFREAEPSLRAVGEGGQIVPPEPEVDIEELQRIIEEQSARIKELEEEAADSSKEEELQTKITELESQVDELKKQLEEAGPDTEKEELKKKIDELNAEISALTQDKEDRETQISDLQAQIEALQKRIEELENGGEDGQEQDPGGVPAALTAGRGIPKGELLSFSKSVRGQAALTRDVPRDGGDDSFTIQTGTRLISPNSEYTAEELKQAIADEEALLRSLDLDEREAELKLKIEKEAVEEGAVHAKMDGVITKAGSKDKPPADGSPLVQLAGSAGVFVKGALSETRLSEVNVGDPVTVQSWQSGMTYPAEITEISPYPSRDYYYGNYSMNTSASSYPFIARITDMKANLEQNEYLQITFSGSAQESELPAAGDSLFLYKAFILEQDGGRYVYKRGEDGLLVKQPVEVGDTSGEGWQILSGVTVNDYVAFPYGKDVREGAKTREGTMEELYAM